MATIAKRWKAEVSGCGRWGGTLDVTSTISVSRSAAYAASPTSMCPTCTGSKVPPRMPRRRAGIRRSCSRLTRRGQAAPHRLEQVRNALAADARHAKERQIQLRRALLQRRGGVFVLGIERVDL